MFIIKKQDKATGKRYIINATYTNELDAINAIKSILTEYELYKTELMRNDGSLSSGSFYSRYYYYNIIKID